MSQDKKEDKSDYWVHHMRMGSFEEAWKFSDKVLASRAGQPCWHWPRHFQYIWNGRSLEGKRVLVRCYHGLGDTIMFIRYAPLLKAITAKVIIWAQPPLIPILESVPEIDELLPLHDGTPEVDYDVDVEIMELPHIFRTTLHTIPAEVPYLQVSPRTLSAEKKHLAVGLVWKPGNWDEYRSIPFRLLAPLAKVPGIQLYILQENAESAGWQEGFGINPGEFGLYEFASILKGLDLLISVDSMPVHLAGALGVPVWTLLHADANWRWMNEREDSPWYPTMRLFRQAQPDDWESLILRVAHELENLARSSIQSSARYFHN